LYDFIFIGSKMKDYIMYECEDCHKRFESKERPEQCPDCGGLMAKANKDLIERATQIREGKEEAAKTGAGSLVCGILSLLVPFGGLILGIILVPFWGLILGIIAVNISHDTDIGKAGKVLGILGIIFNSIGLLVLFRFNLNV
jgi:hypothetical protein